MTTTVPIGAATHKVFHWLVSERASMPSIAEWRGGQWYCVNEVGPISPGEMFRRGWDWGAAIDVPEKWRDESFERDEAAGGVKP